MLKVVEDGAAREELAAGLDEIVREGARRMLAAALEAEVEAYVAAHAGERDEAGRRLVVRNGHARPRQVSTVAGAVEVSAPRVDDRRVEEATGERRRFRSSILPPWCRRQPEGDRGAAAAVPARAVQQGLRAGVGGVLRVGGGAVRLGDHPADHGLAGGAAPVRRAGSVRGGLRLRAGWTGCTSTSASTRTGSAPWSSSGCGPTGRRSWSRSPMGTASPPSRGRTCCGTAGAAGCARRCWRSATGRWGSGRRCARCSRRPESSGTGCTR